MPLKFLFKQYLKLSDICWEKTIKKSSLLLIEAVAQRCSVKNDVLRNFAKSIAPVPESLFFNKDAGLKA